MVFSNINIYTVCPRMKLSRFLRHISQKARRIWQYPFVEQNVVCVPEWSYQNSDAMLLKK